MAGMGCAKKTVLIFTRKLLKTEYDFTRQTQCGFCSSIATEAEESKIRQSELRNASQRWRAPANGDELNAVYRAHTTFLPVMK